MATQRDKAETLRALHQGPRIFLIANAWDAGSARVLAGLGYAALATSSGASAAVLGKRDGEISREQALSSARAIVAATDLPVSADLENGFGERPETVAETIQLAAECGLAGGSIEDTPRERDKPLYDFSLAVERVAAAVEAARKLPIPFALTARTEGLLRGRPDLEDVILRLQAFARLGADVVFAPGLHDLAAVRAVCEAVPTPVSFMAGLKGRSFSVAELEAAGVRRVSVAGSFYRAAISGLVNAATEVRDRGTFTYLER